MPSSVVSYNPFTQWIAPLLGVVLIGIAVWMLVDLVLSRRRLFSDSQRALDWAMLHVLVPKEKEEEGEKTKDFKELISVAEQLFASFAAISKKEAGLFGSRPFVSLEIVAKGTVNFYIGIPREFLDFARKQILSFYPSASVEEDRDFKIFSPGLQTAEAELKLAKRFVFPIKTYQELESDPLNNITNSLSKLGETSRVGIQILMRPATQNWQFGISRTARAIQEGKPLPVSGGLGSKILFNLSLFLGEAFKSKGGQKPTEEQPMKLTPIQEEVLKDLNSKAGKTGFETQIRVIAAGPSEPEAKAHLNNITGSFNQFALLRGNNFEVVYPKNKKDFVRDYIMRSFTAGKRNILNTQELASIYHFPNRYIETPNIAWLLARILPAPVNLPKEGIIIGENVYRGETIPVRIKENDRRRHIYMIGKTGVGKTTLFINMIEQDIKAGKGVCFIDPLGDAIETILELIPKERAEDVILFDPSDIERPAGLNLLEWKRPEEKDFLLQEMIEIFYKLFDPNRTGMVGPQFEHWFRNAALTLMSQPEGGTLIEIPRLFTDDEFMKKQLENVKDPVVTAFWQQQMAKTSEFHKSEMFNYFISKFGRFMTNEMMRNIIGQTKSVFNLREIMDTGKIFLVNLSKGKIGEVNAFLLGMILVSKIQMAAFGRAEIPEEERKDFYLYVDEFQNFTTDTFATILSEARKYRLSLNITNQYIAQLPEKIRDAVVGNAGTIISYRIGAADAEFLEKEFPGVTKEDFTNLSFTNTYIKLLIDGTPSKPFSMRGIKTLTPPNKEMAAAVKALSRLKYGKSRVSVEKEIAERARIEMAATGGGGSFDVPVEAKTI